MKSLKQTLINVLPSILAGVLLTAGIIYAAWQEPTNTPPNNNVSAPINVSTNTQTFQGSKIINVADPAAGQAIYTNGAFGIGGLLRGYSNAIFDGNVGIGTVSPASPAPNGQIGNADTNDVYLRSISKWASELEGDGPCDNMIPGWPEAIACGDYANNQYEIFYLRMYSAGRIYYGAVGHDHSANVGFDPITQKIVVWNGLDENSVDGCGVTNGCLCTTVGTHISAIRHFNFCGDQKITFVGATPATYTGAGVEGYAGGDAKCAAAYPGSRMCAAADFANGTPGMAAVGWFNSFISGGDPGDCGAWKYGGSSQGGTVWTNNGSQGYVYWAQCNKFLSILCCK